MIGYLFLAGVVIGLGFIVHAAVLEFRSLWPKL